MFVKYFQLAEQPFGATPDPRFLFHSNSHREALASLYCSFYANRGFTALIADPGMGKTTLLYEFLEHIRDCAKTVFLFNTFCGPDDVVTYILRDSGIEPGPTVADRYRQINEILAGEARAGKLVVLVIDEAQNLSPHTLEGIRLLTNFETARSKLIQVVLAGQPQLAEALARPDLAQLRQRIFTFCRLTHLSAAETRAYIQHRLTFAGYKGKDLFTPAACELIAQASGGIPRIINTLCFNSLCLCRARKFSEVDDSMVSEALEDLELPPIQPEEQTPQESAAALSFASYGEQRSDRRSILRPIWGIAVAAVLILAMLAGIHSWTTRVEARSLPSQPADLTASVPSSHMGLSPEPASAAEQGQLQSSSLPAVKEESSPLAVPTNKNPQPTTVRVVAGDTLEGIATTHLGAFNGAVLRKIRALNPRITNPNHIETGRSIRLPQIGGPASANTARKVDP